MRKSMKVILKLCTLLIISSCVSTNDVRINTSSLPDAQIGVFYDFQFDGSGGSSNNFWFIREGVLPLGLSFSANGKLSGIPQTLGSFTFTVVYSSEFSSEFVARPSVGVGYSFGSGNIGIGVRSGPILGPAEISRDSRSFTLIVKQ